MELICRRRHFINLLPSAKMYSAAYGLLWLCDNAGCKEPIERLGAHG
jgi:hypothetical protein